MTVNNALSGAALFSLVLGCAACPPAKPAASAATVQEAQLPTDEKALMEYADQQYAKQSLEGAENAAVALRKAAAAGGTIETLWRLARAYAWLAGEYPDSDRREANATKGMEAGEKAVAADAKRSEGFYYLAICRGQYVQLKKDKARDRVPGVVEAAKAAAKIDEKFDSAGPLRILGSVYAQAPEPPVSVGDHEEGIKLLERAVKLDPSYPENQLLLGDAYRVSKKLEDAERMYQAVLAMQPAGTWANRLPRWHKEAQDGLNRVNTIRRQHNGGGAEIF